jgi:peroxiredoxin
MSLQINDVAPDFEAETTEGRIRFHDWIGDSWAMLFSHPKDFTPVCTTELGYIARIKSEFDKRRVKIIGLSVDPVDNHARWAKDIEETQGFAPNYPMIGDTDLMISKAWGMLPAAVNGDASKRVKSLRTLTPFSRPIATPCDRLGLSGSGSCRVGGGAVGKWPAGATAKSLAQVGHLSTAVLSDAMVAAVAISCGS